MFWRESNKSEVFASGGIAIEIMAEVTGLEPATSSVTGRRSNQLSYTPAPP